MVNQKAGQNNAKIYPYNPSVSRGISRRKKGNRPKNKHPMTHLNRELFAVARVDLLTFR